MLILTYVNEEHFFLSFQKLRPWTTEHHVPYGLALFKAETPNAKESHPEENKGRHGTDPRPTP